MPVTVTNTPRALAAAAALMLLASGATAADRLLPDSKLTPGEWNVPPTPLATLCKPGYTPTVRQVPTSLQRQVFRAYGLNPDTINRGDYELDHLVSLELDGTNTAANLWPESYRTARLNARRKDVLENTLKRKVCRGEMPLAKAQRAIAQDWTAAYRLYVKAK